MINYKKLSVVLICLITTGMVYAGGYRVSLQGVRQAAMAHTSAHVQDASVIFFNPAGMGFIEDKFSIALGVFGTAINSEYQNYATLYKHESDNPISTPIYFGTSYKVSDMVSLGLSVTTPFGNSIDWGKDWAGQEFVQDIELRAFYIQPTIAVKFTDWFSAGLGYIYSTGNVTLNRSIQSVGGELGLEGKASGSGFNLGAYFRPVEKLDVSLAYRSKVDMKVKDGDANFNVGALAGNAPFLTANDTFEATLPLVSEFTGGITYRVKDNFILSGDINYSGWQAYHRLTFDFGENLVGNQPDDATVSVTPKDFHYTKTLRIGGEYVTSKNLALRGGYYYDESPVNTNYFTPETPSTDNHYLTFGLGYKLKNGLTIDGFGSKLFGEVLSFNNSGAAFSGQLKNDGFLFGFGLTYNK